METGLLHVYTGEGKGKTTAAIGLAVRAAGTGKRVLFAQFMKSRETGELTALRMLENVDVLRCEQSFPFYNRMTDAQRAAQRREHDKMLDGIFGQVRRRRTDIVILDEITFPCLWDLVDVERLREVLALAKGHTEVVCTGRNAPDWLLDGADYITVMQAERHPFTQGVNAREGIEY